MHSQDAVLPALAILEAAATAPGTELHAPAPQDPQKGTMRKGVPPALEKAEDTARPDPAQATGLGSCEIVRAAARVYEALVAPRLGSADGAAAHAAPRVLWQQRAFAGAVQPLLQARVQVWQYCCCRTWVLAGAFICQQAVAAASR